MGERWREVGDRVYARRHEFLDLNVGLVVGDGRCLVIDTRATLVEAGDLIAAVREVTAHPWAVANTHTHWDHYFGNAAFRPAEIWAHERAAAWAREYGSVHKEGLKGQARREADLAEFVEQVDAVTPDPPDRTFADDAATLDIGGRAVTLRYHGRGHTDGDITINVDAVTFAGDLVEEGASVGFSDSFPLDWPGTLDALLVHLAGPVVPGHGDVVDLAYVRGQRDEVAAIAELARAGHAEGRDADSLAADLPLPDHQRTHAARRAYRQLDRLPSYDSPEAALAALLED
jgi:glyoxylase-like metal-dependent hydrolase (beta-lactamase superfamily II)